MINNWAELKQKNTEEERKCRAKNSYRLKTIISLNKTISGTELEQLIDNSVLRRTDWNILTILNNYDNKRYK